MEKDYSEILNSLPDEVFWPVMDEIENRPLIISDTELRKELEELDQLVSDCLNEDPSVAKITEEDEQ